VGVVDVALCLKFFPEVGMIVDLAVVADVQCAVFVCHRLMAGSDIYNTQTPMTEPDISIDEDAAVIRTAVRDAVAHADDEIGSDPPVGTI